MQQIPVEQTFCVKRKNCGQCLEEKLRKLVTVGSQRPLHVTPLGFAFKEVLRLERTGEHLAYDLVTVFAVKAEILQGYRSLMLISFYSDEHIKILILS